MRKQKFRDVHKALKRVFMWGWGSGGVPFCDQNLGFNWPTPGPSQGESQVRDSV